MHKLRNKGKEQDSKEGSAETRTPRKEGRISKKERYQRRQEEHEGKNRGGKETRAQGTKVGMKEG
jgi:hypothetical protein